jgi:hypothetical protein
VLNREIDTAMYSSIVTDNLQWNPAIGRWKRRQQANNEQHAQRIDWQLLKTKNVNAVDLVAAAKLLIGKLTPKLHSEHAILLSLYDRVSPRVFPAPTTKMSLLLAVVSLVI